MSSVCALIHEVANTVSVDAREGEKLWTDVVEEKKKELDDRLKVVSISCKMIVATPMT